MCTRLIHISPVTGQFIVRLKLFLNGNCPQIGIQIQCSMQIYCFKIRSISYELCFKQYLVEEGTRALTDEHSKARANEIDRAPTASDIFCSGHMQHERERPDMKRK